MEAGSSGLCIGETASTVMFFDDHGFPRFHARHAASDRSSDTLRWRYLFAHFKTADSRYSVLPPKPWSLPKLPLTFKSSASCGREYVVVRPDTERPEGLSMRFMYGLSSSVSRAWLDGDLEARIPRGGGCYTRIPVTARSNSGSAQTVSGRPRPTAAPLRAARPCGAASPSSGDR